MVGINIRKPRKPLIYTLWMGFWERVWLWHQARFWLKHSDSRVRYEAVKNICYIAIWGIANRHASHLLVKVYEDREETPRNRGEALDGIWSSNPQWLPTIHGIEILEEAVNQLITLFDQTNDGEEFIDHGVSSERVKEVGTRLAAFVAFHSTRAEPVRDIGTRLDAIGGFDLMLLACVRFKLQRPRAIWTLNQLWWGVGSWPQPDVTSQFVL
jgi:hypothetical protein